MQFVRKFLPILHPFRFMRLLATHLGAGQNVRRLPLFHLHLNGVEVIPPFRPGARAASAEESLDVVAAELRAGVSVASVRANSSAGRSTMPVAGSSWPSSDSTCSFRQPL